MGLATASVDEDPPMLMLLQIIGAVYCTGLGVSSEPLAASRQATPFKADSDPDCRHGVVYQFRSQR